MMHKASSEQSSSCDRTLEHNVPAAENALSDLTEAGGIVYTSSNDLPLTPFDSNIAHIPSTGDTKIQLSTQIKQMTKTPKTSGFRPEKSRGFGVQTAPGSLGFSGSGTPGWKVSPGS
jgi:hypothetical protein